MNTILSDKDCTTLSDKDCVFDFRQHLLMLWTAFKLTVGGIVIIAILFGLFFLQALVAQRIVDHNQAEVDKAVVSSIISKEYRGW